MLEPRRIALIKPSALGDIVHALPVLSTLRERFPDAHITWIVNKSYEPLLVGHPDLNATLTFDRHAFKRGAWQSARYALRFAAELRRQRFDLVLDLQGLLRTGLMCLATGARHRIGFAHAREGSRHAYTRKVLVPDAARIHAVERYWRMAQAIGAGTAVKRFHVPLQAQELEWAQSELAAWPRPWLAFAVGARWLTKRWPTSHFAELARRAHTTFGGTAFFVGAQDDIALSHDVCQILPGRTKDFTGKTSLPRLAALLALCDVMIANDTGPLHLAAALGRPCIAPYTCTKVIRHGPYGSLSGGIETSVACRGSYLKKCAKMICMTDLTPDSLWRPLAEVLDTWQRNRLCA